MNVRAIASTYCPVYLRPAFARIEASPLGLRLARGVFWSMAGAVISRGLMLVATVVVARLLGKTTYGELGMIQSTVGMFGTFAGFGLGLTATKHVAEFRQSDPARAGRIIALSSVVAIVTGGVMGLALAVLAPWLAEHTISAPHLTGVLRIGALILFLNAINGAQTGALSGFEAFRTIARVNLLVGILSFPILVAGALWGGLAGAVWALTVNLALGWLFNRLALHRETRRHRVPFTLSGAKQEWSVVWEFSLPAVLAGSMTGPVNWVCGALLVHQPDGYAEMGVFSAANQWFNVLLFFPSLLNGVVLPVLSQQFGDSNKRQSWNTILFAIKANLLLVLPITITASIASSYIMSLYGDEFCSGSATLIVTLLTAAVFAITAPIAQALAATGRMWIGFAMNASWAIVCVAATLALLSYGSLGLASARGIAYLLHSLWVLAYAVHLARAPEEHRLPLGNTHVC